jgi:Globin
MKFFAVLALCIVAAISAPLSVDEAALVKESWAKVHQNEVDILANLFTLFPQYQSRFPAFVGKDLATLKETAKFAIHATRIV